MSYPFIMQGNNVTVVIGNKPHTISKTHITYQKVVDAIKQGDWDTVKDIIEPKKVVLDFGQGRVSIKGETLYWDGEVFNGTIAVRMINMLQEGFTIEPLVKFMENLLENPSKRSVDELYGFLEKNNLPITPDGHFLAYKKIKDDYAISNMDVRSTKSRLRGAMTYGVGGPVLIVKDVNVEFDPIDFDFLRQINGKPFPYDWQGTIRGVARGRGESAHRGPVQDDDADPGQARDRRLALRGGGRRRGRLLRRGRRGRRA